MPFGKTAVKGASAPPAKKAPVKKGAVKKGAVKKGAVKKGAAKKSAAVLFKAPEDFKPAFFEVKFETLADGLINGGSIEVNRVKGKWDNPDAPRFNLAEYDQPTLIGIATRLGAMSHAPAIPKRLLPKTRFKTILRVNKRAATGALAILPKGTAYLGIGKAGKPTWFWVNTKSEGVGLQICRRFRKMSKFLAGAFIQVQLPPSKRKSRKGASEEE
jgi:hypothetical protein